MAGIRHPDLNMEESLLPKRRCRCQVRSKRKIKGGPLAPEALVWLVDYTREGREKEGGEEAPLRAWSLSFPYLVLLALARVT